MRCPLCGSRKARRVCPAQGRDICSVCCGSKRLVEIACPSDCVYLASAREHPPAVEVRRHQQDMNRLAPVLRDFSRLQGELFLLCAAAIVRDPLADGLHRLLDEDVVSAAGAAASTLETAARGVIYEHRPSTRSAERLSGALRTLLVEAAKSAGPRVEREAVLVLRRLEEGAKAAMALQPRDERAFIDLLGRVLRLPERAASAPVVEAPEEPGRLIVP